MIGIILLFLMLIVLSGHLLDNTQGEGFCG